MVSTLYWVFIPHYFLFLKTKRDATKKLLSFNVTPLVV
ncbi:hypothetical protein SPAR143_0670 [Streptococcus pneumoniae NP070]|nr:hypothetical protein SPAR143_0670 [Streptococcus pneumoniae NP070]EHZ26425.1 hypothetical protein SPAR36_0671 [Streptococcus pneumoniae GA14688]EHZ53930.1 hypothetical protein SPAR79_0688 [Streptococcus pneumoniae GA44128]EJG34816.1 hypothetical protein AMCSP11_001173 [Streptococcus pneumoniae 2070005]EJG47185.1 hypothetical protein AMCSP06_002346 [Streptococcus pneumoniae 2070768]EJH09146.1 hypothetical protein SPAR47_1962 [Streptococcus pneumoniae GA17484]